MARGFESKDVEFQQAERVASRRETLTMSLARLHADLEQARRPAHRSMLEQAIATLEAELASLT
jgi:hypothetical protein